MKKFFLAMLIAVLAMSFIACNNGSDRQYEQQQFSPATPTPILESPVVYTEKQWNEMMKNHQAEIERIKKSYESEPNVTILSASTNYTGYYWNKGDDLRVEKVFVDIAGNVFRSGKFECSPIVREGDDAADKDIIGRDKAEYQACVKMSKLLESAPVGKDLVVNFKELYASQGEGGPVEEVVLRLVAD